MIRRLTSFLLIAILPAHTASGQGRSAVLGERQEFAEWIRASLVSPLRAVAVRPIGPELSLGPSSAEVPLSGVEPSRFIQEGGRVRLLSSRGSQPVVRGRPMRLGARWLLVVNGQSGRVWVTVFDSTVSAEKQPDWFGYDSTMRLIVTLNPAHLEPVRLLGLDGVEIEATEAGTVTVQAGGKASPLRVFRTPGSTEEETELEIYFRDATSGHQSYSSGRFVSLIPMGGDRFLLDFNRARNPFCAYNTVYPCPAPWRGNVLDFPVRAGEKYHPAQ